MSVCLSIMCTFSSSHALKEKKPYNTMSKVNTVVAKNKRLM